MVPALGRLAARIPGSVASAMLAGVLLPFCFSLFRVAGHDRWLVGIVVAVFLAARQRLPLYALLLAIDAGTAFSLLNGDLTAIPPGAMLGSLVPVTPAFSASALVSLALPLFLVTLVSQNLPGLVVLRSAGYHPRPGLLLSATGLATMLTASFGAHSVNLAAITAAICTNDEAHPDHARRLTVGVLYAGCHIALALFAPMLVRVFWPCRMT